MRDVIVIRIKTRLVILGVWTLLIALLVLFQYLRVHHWIAQERYRGPLLLAAWIPLVTFALVGIGFWLASVRWMLGQTPLGRYWTTLYVGIVCLVALLALGLDMMWHVQLRTSYW